MLLESLRARTRPLHAQLDNALWVQPLLDSSPTKKDYQTYLEKIYLGLLPFEILLLHYLQQDDMNGYSPFAPAIQQDLWSIGSRSLPPLSPLPQEDSKFLDPSFRVGVRYVIECTAMNGPVIWRNLKSKLNIPEDAATFIRRVYLEPDRWVKFSSLLFELSESLDQDLAFEGAQTVYDHFFSLAPQSAAAPPIESPSATNKV